MLTINIRTKNASRSGKLQHQVCLRSRSGKTLARVQYHADTLLADKLEKIIEMVNNPPRVYSNVETLPDYLL